MIKTIILGTARGVRHLDANKSYPLALEELEQGGRVLDWVLRALAAQSIDASQTIFVGGYHLEKVVEGYPGLKYYFYPDWERDGEIGALRLVREEIDGPCFIFNTGIVIRGEALDALKRSEADIAVGVLGTAEREKPESTTTGLAWFNDDGAEVLRHLLNRIRRTDRSLKELVRSLISHGADVQTVDVSADCAELRDTVSLSRFVLGSKAETLERLRPLLRRAVVLDQVKFLVSEWEADPGSVVDRISHTYGDTHVVVRSSAAPEDSWSASHAGRFTSVPDVSPADTDSLTQAIDAVIASYAAGGVEAAINEVFVQPYLSNVAASGVVLTRNLDTGAPYYVITCDRSTGRTDSVESGSSSPLETFVLYRNAQTPLSDPVLAVLVPAVQEIEQLTGHDSLDIEFAIDRDGGLYILQVRPLLVRNGSFDPADADIDDELAQVREFASSLMGRHPHLAGATTQLGNMSDWNPAEMIGVAPRALALSLYQVLITDYAWAEARREIGYRDVTSQPLLVTLAGAPYVDIRASFNSFLPATLDDDTSERLVDAYLDHLRSHPELHDKIEFEVAATCLAFDFERHAQRLLSAGLDQSDVSLLRKRLLTLTDQILCGVVAPFDRQSSHLSKLAENRHAILNEQPSGGNLPRAISFLVRDCVRYGTVPFSIQARYAFIAMTFLKSLTHQDVLTADEYQAFLNAIPTVATNVSRDVTRLVSGELGPEEFAGQYGHLRPGTYDILSPNYLQSIPTFLNGAAPNTESSGGPVDLQPNPQIAIEIFGVKSRQISGLLEQFGFQCDAQKLLNFIMRAIPERERAKFEFTKSVNKILELVARYGEYLGLSEEDASHLSIERIGRFATDSPSSATSTHLKRASRFEAKRHILTSVIRLPDLIQDVSEIDCFRLPEWQPNFITNQRVVGEVADLERDRSTVVMGGKIVLIRSADPGYDWIFSYGPAGLVTQYGGAASHMAIRAAEFGLPSAIGCGELAYERVRKATRVEIDSPNQQIRVIH